MKIQQRFGDLPKIVEKAARKKKKPKEIAVVQEPRCTGCQTCVDFCPVDCIEIGPERPGVPVPPVIIRYDECIGCEICVRVCEDLVWDAIEMWPTEKVERAFKMTIGDKYVGTSAPAPAAGAARPPVPAAGPGAAPAPPK
ncbi:MAG: 4Fe-4S dicluster domain-containing protein [Planctomycetales bacterium]|nr:4Fe-4S dicluster domain-containing protein [Planctomycetales bacterium]